MNSKDSESLHISRKQAAETIDAVTYSWRNGLWLNRICHFDLTSLDIRPQDFLSAFTKLAGDYLSIHFVPRAYLWALEHPPGRNLNAHLLIHVPHELNDAFVSRQRSWAKLAGLKLHKGAFTSDKIAPKDRKTEETSEGDYLNNLQPIVEYMLKGSDEETCNHLRLDHWPQGRIYGKRVGVAELIGRSSRKVAGYVPPSSERNAILFRHRHLLGG